jgi:hypothetical protein
LIEAGRTELAAELLLRLVKAQTDIFRANEHFYEFYHSDQPQGLGTPGHLGGIVPLHLFLRVLGIRVVSDTKVWVGGTFHLPAPVMLRQRGVTVRRSTDETSIQFPSGYEVTLPASYDWQEVIDPHPKPRTTTSQRSADD